MDQASLERHIANIRATGGPTDALRRDAARTGFAAVAHDLMGPFAGMIGLTLLALMSGAGPWVWGLIAILFVAAVLFHSVAGRRQRQKHAALVAEYDRRYGVPPPPPVNWPPPPPV